MTAATAEVAVKRRDEGATINLVTHDVRRFGGWTSGAAEWISGLKDRWPGGLLDVIILQETHATKQEAGQFERRYASNWGYRVGENLPARFFWTPSNGRFGGMAILVHPRSRLTDTTPSLLDLWSPHFCAIQATMDGRKWLVANVYAPRDKIERQRQFQAIGDV